MVETADSECLRQVRMEREVLGNQRRSPRRSVAAGRTIGTVR